MRIRVLKMTSTGDEPRFVREAWVGLVLPLKKGKRQPVLVPPARLPSHVLSLGQRIVRLFSRQLDGQPMPAYIVDAEEGFEILKRERPEAARWWLKKFPEVLSGRFNFRFAVENCEELGDESVPDTGVS